MAIGPRRPLTCTPNLTRRNLKQFYHTTNFVASFKGEGLASPCLEQEQACCSPCNITDNNPHVWVDNEKGEPEMLCEEARHVAYRACAEFAECSLARSRRLTKSLLMLMGGRVCAWCRSSGKRCCVPWLDVSPLRASYARPGWLETPRTWNTKGSGTKTDSHGNTLLDSVWAREKNDLILLSHFVENTQQIHHKLASDKNNCFLRQ